MIETNPDLGQQLSPDEKQELVNLRRRNRISLETPEGELSEGEKIRLKELGARPGGEKPETILDQFNKES